MIVEAAGGGIINFNGYGTKKIRYSSTIFNDMNRDVKKGPWLNLGQTCSLTSPDPFAVLLSLGSVLRLILKPNRGTNIKYRLEINPKKKK